MNADAELDTEVQAWNATLATGTPEQIKHAQRELLALVHKRVMDDEPNYRAAGWSR